MAQQKLTISDAELLVNGACLSVGANQAAAHSLTQATLSAALAGRHSVGFPHLLDYLDGFDKKRINGTACPAISSPLPAFIHSDADGGIAQLGFDNAMPTLVTQARDLGVTLFTQNNSFTTGELGFYVRRLAAEGLIALAVSNSPAVVASSPGCKPTFGTNPMAFAAPLSNTQTPLVIDQASSAIAFVNLVKAAADDTPIPESWAIDANGAATTDARAALSGALLAFGGHRGANIALMVECLAAGLSGAAWSLDMADFQSGSNPVDAGMTIIAIQPSAVEANFSDRLSAQLDRISALGTHVPGRRTAPSETNCVIIDQTVLDRIRAFL